MGFPRSSQLGYYFMCDERAARDRAAPRGDTRNAPADFGTVVHYLLMTLLGKTVTKYSDELLRSAMTWDSMDMAIKIAESCVMYFPNPDEWDCEVEFDNGIWTGHVDFLRKDRTEIIDFKTTSKEIPPEAIEWHYLWQQLAYATQFPEVKTIRLLYAHSHGQWKHMSNPYPVTDQHRAFVRKKMAYLHSPHLTEFAVPNPGEHCKKTWCPYVNICHKKLAPEKGGTTNYNHKPISLGFFAKKD